VNRILHPFFALSKSASFSIFSKTSIMKSHINIALADWRRNREREEAIKPVCLDGENLQVADIAAIA
jgi:hypothetical protein